MNSAEQAAVESEAQTVLGFMPKLQPELQSRSLLRFRRLVHRTPLDASERAVLETELQAMDEWRREEEQRASEMHIVDARTAEEVAAAKKRQELVEAGGLGVARGEMGVCTSGERERLRA